MSGKVFGMVLACALLATACSGSNGTPPIVEEPAVSSTTSVPSQQSDPISGLAAQVLADGFAEPVALAHAPSVGEVFVVEKQGTLRQLHDETHRTVLNISERVLSKGNEQGFLGFAVHPDFPKDSRGFAVYTDRNGDLVISSFLWTGLIFDQSSEEEVLFVDQPHQYHQGGDIVFGPRGLMWLSLGDGGGRGDQRGNGQDPTTLRGTLVRIDIDNGDPYGVPNTNPFVGTEAGADEVWAYGLRNPWRFTFDGEQLVIVDVGEFEADEVNVVPADEAGLNYGWPILEGTTCFKEPECTTEGLTAPVYEVPRVRSCATIGGPVYRGAVVPELTGHLFFADFCTGWIRSAPVLDGALGAVMDWEHDLGTLGMITTFGVDVDGEILVANQEGTVYRLVPKP